MTPDTFVEEKVGEFNRISDIIPIQCPKLDPDWLRTALQEALEQGRREERERINQFHKCTCETCTHYGIRDCLVNLGCNRCNPALTKSNGDSTPSQPD